MAHDSEIALAEDDRIPPELLSMLAPPVDVEVAEVTGVEWTKTHVVAEVRLSPGHTLRLWLTAEQCETLEAGLAIARSRIATADAG